MQPSNIKMIDIITVLKSMKKTLELNINQNCILVIKVNTSGVLHCKFTNAIGKTIIMYLDDTDTFNDLVMFCAKGYIDMVDDHGNIGVNLNGLNETLTDTFSTIVNTIGSKQVSVFSNHIRRTGKCIVWLFGDVTVTLDAISDGLSITSDADDEECKCQTLLDEESLNELLISVSLCTGVLNPISDEVIYNHSAVFQQITATLQHVDISKGN